MKRIAIVLGALIALAVIAMIAVVGVEVVQSQRADYGWSPTVASPRYAAEHPRVVFDEGHNNASTAGFSGRYWPFARLLRADGYAVERGRDPFTAAGLEDVAVLVVANASGQSKPQMFGINLPSPRTGERSDPAFTAAEIEAVRSWVERGGSLLLIADHAPFGACAADLARAFGVTMHNGFVEVPGELSDPLLFSRENGRLAEHAILDGEGPGAAVGRVMTFTGQSLDGPDGSSALLRLPSEAVETVAQADSFVEHPAGAAQGLALEYGAGRVVVLGEAALATAQVSKRERFGMNSPGSDNGRFVLNTMHWLSRSL